MEKKCMKRGKMGFKVQLRAATFLMLSVEKCSSGTENQLCRLQA